MLFAAPWDHANRPSPRSASGAGEGTVVLLIGSLRARATLRAVLDPAGYAVTEAEDVDEGQRLARKLHPHLAIVELDMPVRDGWAACRRLKADPETYLIPLVATVLDRPDPGSYHRARSAGFVDLIARPLERRHVLEVVGTWSHPGPRAMA
jgi:CheY-like chemotaxis protein